MSAIWDFLKWFTSSRNAEHESFSAFAQRQTESFEALTRRQDTFIERQERVITTLCEKIADLEVRAHKCEEDRHGLRCEIDRLKASVGVS